MIVKPSELEIDFLATDLVRSEGVHASDIYNDLFKHLDPKRYNHDDEELNPVLMALGSAWEKHLEYLLVKNGITAERPSEFYDEEDDVAYSPDLIFFNGVTRLGEIKLTSMSVTGMPDGPANFLPPKLDKYLCQMKLYAYWLHVFHGWLAIVFMHQPWNPQFRMYDLEWNQRELDENHRMCMNHARHSGILPQGASWRNSAAKQVPSTDSTKPLPPTSSHASLRTRLEKSGQVKRTSGSVRRGQS